MNRLEVTAREVATRLGDPVRAVRAVEFPRDRQEASHPGMYAWWVDPDGLATIAQVLGTALRSLVYAGQAGATSTRSGRPSGATLLTRVRGQHIRGNVYGSTMRRTFAAVLFDPLELRSDGPKRLADNGEARLRAWIENHLSVSVTVIEDTVALAQLEPLVLQLLDPPLNLDHVPPTDARRRLRALRQAFGRATPTN